eukprot:GILI01009415.1.p1 GENE.GILI01009415.1~~GILI01009415.1.p1  ORF type:complete len:249 (+),score=73.77 GILI01009415.1:24-749(+)
MDDDLPQLSAHALAALSEFREEQKKREEEAANKDPSKASLDDLFAEDWNLSQFWYDRETADALARQAVAASKGGPIACVSSPSIFRSLLEVAGPEQELLLLEFDDRFAAFGERFVHYDYKQPLTLPAHLRGHFAVVVADPPFLSEECLTKTCLTIRWLSKPAPEAPASSESSSASSSSTSSTSTSSPTAIMLCTGAVMKPLAKRLLSLRPSKFRPSHTRKLGNEFMCFCSFKPLVLGGWDK